MADELSPFALNIRGVDDLVSSDTNKVESNTADSEEGAVGDGYGVLELSMSNDQLIKLANQWTSLYAPYESKMKGVFKRNLESYLGHRKDGAWLATDGVPIAANIQFEAVETFLSAALAKNPDPVVFGPNTPEGNAQADAVKTMLQFHADQLVIRRKLAFMVRQWSIYHLGVLKYGWNANINDIEVSTRKIENFVFDPEGYVNCYGEFVGYLGERIDVSAQRLAELFPKHKEDIALSVKGQMGTPVRYTEWWSADEKYTFCTYKGIVLDKHKNEFFNYAENEKDATGAPVLDEYGEPTKTNPRNHFAQPKKPFTFLSVYSLQEQPHDITSNIEQNIPNQEIVKRRTEQIDFNMSAANNSYAFSADNFTEQTAKQAADARRKGNPILVPSGKPIGEAILALDAQNLPSGVFNSLEIAKNDMRSSWGIQGIMSQAVEPDETVRGQILAQQHDSTRIGGGIGDAIEQVADHCFNWMTQLYYVFYDEKHFAAIMGNAKAVEYVELSNEDLNVQLIVSVAPDSMKPKDEISQMNMAKELFTEGVIDPKTLLTMLGFPNAEDAAAAGMLYKLDPQAYMQMNFPEFMQEIAQGQPAQPAAPSPATDGSIPPTPPQPPIDISAGPASPNISQVPLPPVGEPT